MIFKWEEVQAFINPTIRYHFVINEDNLQMAESKKQTFAIAEQNITSRIKFYVPCVAQHASDFIHIFAAFFDFMFIGEANEKHDTSYSQITENYNKALEWLEEHGGDYCVKQQQRANVERLTSFAQFEERVADKFL